MHTFPPRHQGSQWALEKGGGRGQRGLAASGGPRDPRGTAHRTPAGSGPLPSGADAWCRSVRLRSSRCMRSPPARCSSWSWGQEAEEQGWAPRGPPSAHHRNAPPTHTGPRIPRGLWGSFGSARQRHWASLIPGALGLPGSLEPVVLRLTPFCAWGQTD